MIRFLNAVTHLLRTIDAKVPEGQNIGSRRDEMFVAQGDNPGLHRKTDERAKHGFRSGDYGLARNEQPLIEMRIFRAVQFRISYPGLPPARLNLSHSIPELKLRATNVTSLRGHMNTSKITHNTIPSPTRK